MPIHQVLMAGRATYSKATTLLDTLAGGAQYTVSNYDRSIAVFEGVLYATVSTSGPSYTGRVLYANADNGTISAGATTGYTSGIASGLYGETTTPPGWLVYVAYPANNVAYRWNVDDATSEYVNKSVNATMEVWSDSAQAMFGTNYNGSNSRLCAFTNFDWGAHTVTLDTATYTGGGGTTQEIFQNGALVSGRVYITVDRSGAGSFGWVDTATGAYTAVKDYAQNFSQGLLCADNYLGTNPYIAIQCGDTNNANKLDIWDTAGVLQGQITLPDVTTTSYGAVNRLVHDRINNYVWVKVGSSHILVCNPTTLSVVDRFDRADLPSGLMVYPIGPTGSLSGGIYALNSGFTSLYKLG